MKKHQNITRREAKERKRLKNDPNALLEIKQRRYASMCAATGEPPFFFLFLEALNMGKGVEFLDGFKEKNGFIPKGILGSSETDGFQEYNEEICYQMARGY